VEFQIVANGYSPEQVQQAIEALSKQYKALHAQYTQQETQYAENIEYLKQKNAELEQSEHWPANIDTQTIGRALIAAEATAQNLINNAKAKAESIVRETKVEVNDLLMRRKKILNDTRALFQNELDSLPLE